MIIDDNYYFESNNNYHSCGQWTHTIVLLRFHNDTTFIQKFTDLLYYSHMNATSYDS